MVSGKMTLLRLGHRLGGRNTERSKSETEKCKYIVMCAMYEDLIIA